MADMNGIAQSVSTKVATVATYGGGTSAFLGGVTANEIAAFGGLAIGIVGLLMNWWFKHQHLKIARKKQQADPNE